MSGQYSPIARLTSAWGLATRIAAGILFTRIWRATRRPGGVDYKHHQLIQVVPRHAAALLRGLDENCVHGCLSLVAI